MASGRVTAVAVTNTAAVAAVQNINRKAITFSCGDAANSCSVILKDHIDATASNGFPLTFSAGKITFKGKMATHRWSVIRLAAVNCVLGVVEEFEDNYAVPEADSGIPT